MPDQTTTIESLTRAQIRSEIERFSLRDRELTEMAATAYKNGLGGDGAAVDARDTSVHERARAMLSGHASTLLPKRPASGQREQDILAEREAVRLVLATLLRADVEAAVVEALRWAEDHNGEWRALLREWTIAVARFEFLENAVRQYREAAGAAFDALPLSNLPAGRSGVEAEGWWVTRGNLPPFQGSVDDAIDAAVEGGVVSTADLRKARRVGAAQ